MVSPWMGPGVPDFYQIHVFEDPKTMKPKRKLGQMEDLEKVLS